MGADPKGHATLSCTTCSLSIGSLDIHFSGGASWLYNLFSSDIADTLKDSLQGQVNGLFSSLLLASFLSIILFSLQFFSVYHSVCLYLLSFGFFLSIILFVHNTFFVAFFSLSFCFHSVSITRLSFSFPHLLLLFALVKVCDAAKSAIDTQGNAALESVPVVEEIDSTSEIDYRLLEKPTFTTEYMATIHKVSHTEFSVLNFENLLKLFRTHCIFILTLLTLVFLLPGRVLLHRSPGRGTLHPSPPPSHHQHHKDDLFLADRLHCGECGICVHHSGSSAV